MRIDIYFKLVQGVYQECLIKYNFQYFSNYKEFLGNKESNIDPKINDLKNQLENANKTISGLKLELVATNKKYLDSIKILKEEIIKKDEEIKNLNNSLSDLQKKYKIIKFNQNKLEEKKSFDKCVNFTSTDSKLNFAIPCSGNNVFAEVEEMLYKEYPEYRETNNLFLADGNQILRFKTIDENKIGTGRPIMLVMPEDSY